MGFFSELKVLVSDIGDIVKDSGKEIGGILEDAKQEFKDDPKKYTIDSIKEVGSAAGTAAVFLGKLALEEGKDAIKRNAQYKSEMSESDDDSLLRTMKKEMSGSPLKSGAALAELKSRGYSQEDIADKLRNS